MIFFVVVNSKVRSITLSDDVLSSGESFYSKIDEDMDKGWQIGREWVEQPSTHDRCKVAADRILSAMMSDKEGLATLLAGYIADRLPGTIAVNLDTSGEMADTEFFNTEQWSQKSRPASPEEIQQQAEKEVASVHKVGKNYRFARFNPITEQWIESSLSDSEEQAESLRREAIEQRIGELAKTTFWLGG